MKKTTAAWGAPTPSDATTILAIANAIAPLEPGVADALLGAMRIQVLRAEEPLLQLGQEARHEYFVIAGVLRSWVGDAAGREVTLDFSVGPGILWPAIVRASGGRSRIHCHALSGVRVARFEADLLVDLMRTVANAQCWGDAVLRAELMRRVDREWALAALSATQRLAQFRQQFPGLEGSIAQHHIASYLGVTPVSLSRLKAKERVQPRAPGAGRA